MTLECRAPRRGSILLIHGSAPFHADGFVPDPRAGKYFRVKFYLSLSHLLEAQGWEVFRYNKPGVTEHGIDFEIYKTTDLNCLAKQLRDVWAQLPRDMPRLVFAFSEGSLHISQLPMSDLDGAIILGGISTNIRDVFVRQSQGHEAEVADELRTMSQLPRDQMLGMDRPVGRLLDELAMRENWTYFEPHPNLPLLVLHGDEDDEVHMEQALLWPQKLGPGRVSLKVKRGGNHMFGAGDEHGAEDIAREIKSWWLSHYLFS